MKGIFSHLYDWNIRFLDTWTPLSYIPFLLIENDP